MKKLHDANNNVLQIIHCYSEDLNAEQIINMIKKHAFVYKHAHWSQYQTSAFNICISYHHQWIIYNTLFQSMSLLEHAEYLEMLQEETRNENLKNHFIKQGFWIEKGIDEKKIYLDVVHKIRPYILTKSLGLTILPTLKCNARCFYCFEQGIQQISMTKQTAQNIIHFIEIKPDIEKVQFTWFGGEPMMNAELIEYICNWLFIKNIPLTSQMITNGYLLDNPEKIKNAKKYWHLKSVQITLDGLYETYNQRKNYMNPCINPFEKVIHNILLLSHQHIHVTIRLNIDKDNFEEIIDLCQWLVSVFKDNKYVHAYGEFIRDNPKINSRIFVTFEERQYVMQKIMSILIKGNLFQVEELFQEYPRITACMNDHLQAYVINPDGTICQCENESGSEECIIGEINHIDENTIQSSKHLNLSKQCESCQFLPMCLGGCQFSHRLDLEPCFLIRYAADTLIRAYVRKQEVL